VENMHPTTRDRAHRIRELNDAFRASFTGGKVMITAGVDAIAVDVKRAALAKVQTFDAFTKDNDPFGEHDFGSFEPACEKFFFKIDYYAPDKEHGSEDTSDPSTTVRVFAIMLAEEY
jgi:hypothetical protein